MPGLSRLLLELGCSSLHHHHAFLGLGLLRRLCTGPGCLPDQADAGVLHLKVPRHPDLEPAPLAIDSLSPGPLRRQWQGEVTESKEEISQADRPVRLPLRTTRHLALGSRLASCGPGSTRGASTRGKRSALGAPA